MEKKITQIVILLSTVYLVTIFIIPETHLLLWITALLIIINYGLSLVYLFRQGKITVSIAFLNVIQLALFCCLHILIYDLLGSEHYSYVFPPRWYDWLQLVAVHVLRAVDLLDALGAYGIHLQNVKHQSILVGIVLFTMHIMVDIFLLGAIFMFINYQSSSSQSPSRISIFMQKLGLMERFKNMLDFFRGIRRWGLALAIILIIIVGVSHHWSWTSWVLWPLDNILRTLDFGDAFQIFDWHLHSLEKSTGLATLAVFFRLMVSAYVLGLANRFYLYLLRGRGKTIDELAKICTSSEYSPEEQRIAVKALVRLNSDVSILYLIKVLENSKSAEVRHIVIEALGEIGSSAKKAVPSLIKALVDNDSGVRWVAAIALEERIEPQWQQNEGAINIIPYLIKALLNRESEVRCVAAETLGKMGKNTTMALFPLVKALADECSHVRKAAANALKQIEPQWYQSKSAHRAIPYLIKIVNKRSDIIRCAIAIETLIQIVPQWCQSKHVRHAIPYFITGLLDNNPIIVHRVTMTLNKIDPHWQQSKEVCHAIPHLVKALTDKHDSFRRVAAADVLKKIDPKADKIAPSLVTILTNYHQMDNLRWLSAKSFDTLTQIVPHWLQSKGTHRAIHTLATALINNKPKVRCVAAQTLGKMGYAAIPTIPKLVSTLVDNDSLVRCSAADALNQIEPQWARCPMARRAIPHLLTALAKPESDICCAAAQTLGKMGAGAAIAIPHLLKKRTNNCDEAILWTLEAAMHQIDPNGKFRKIKPEKGEKL